MFFLAFAKTKLFSISHCRTVQAVVELKNKPALWHKAKKVTLQSGQTEVKIEFPLPIVACNLMIEYANFYENIQVSLRSIFSIFCTIVEFLKFVQNLP